MSVDMDRIDDLVSIERGEIDRRIFSDEEIFERELEQIFGRAWLFLCHESQVKKPGDAQWTDMSDLVKASAVTDVKCPDGSRTNIMMLNP